jgi:hypothetical protein
MESCYDYLAMQLATNYAAVTNCGSRAYATQSPAISRRETVELSGVPVRNRV